MTLYKKNTHSHTKGCNHTEHKRWNRRSFLQALGLVGGGTVAFANSALSVAKPSAFSAALNQSDNDRILILIRLKGGNDGLNTVIPLYDYDTYKSARPFIGFNKSQLFNLSDDFGMPKYANALERMWGDGQMKIAHGVGYEDSSLSHFTGSDIWASTDPTDEELTGWMGRYFEDLYPDYLLNTPEKPAAIQIGSTGNRIFDGTESNFAFSVADPKKLYDIAKNGELYDLSDLPTGTHGSQVGYLKGIANTTFAYAGVINEAYDDSTDFNGYPDNKLAQQLSIVSRLIKGDLGTKVYLVTLGGFDTHDNQTARHTELITTLSETVSKFYEDLKSAGWEDKVLAMTISEFGRRVAENGSGGTDHGAASPSLFFGPALEGNGFISSHPDLSELNRTGNITSTTDFRQLYATVMKEWLCIDPTLVDQVLLGQKYEPLSLGFGCSTLSTSNPSLAQQGFEHVVTYDRNQIYLQIQNTQTRHVDIRLYNIIGQEVASLKNEMLFEGNYTINIKEAANNRIESGTYIYRILASGSSVSGKVFAP